MPVEGSPAEYNGLVVWAQACIVALVGIDTLLGIGRSDHEAGVAVVGFRKEQVESDIGSDAVIGSLGVMCDQHVATAVVRIGKNACLSSPTAANLLPAIHAFVAIAIGAV